MTNTSFYLISQKIVLLQNARACTSTSLLSLKVYFQLAGKHVFWPVKHLIEGEPGNTHHLNFNDNKEC